MHKFVLALVMGLASAASLGCSTVHSSAVRTGPLSLPARTGPVGIYTVSPPPGGRDLGLVEVHGVGDDGSIENLLPEFARRVAELGGNAAYVQDVRAHFEVVTYLWGRSYGYGCGRARFCTGTSLQPAAEEVMVVSMTGRAMTAPNQPGAPATAVGSNPTAARVPVQAKEGEGL